MAKQNAIDNKAQELTIDPGASGDSFAQFDINGTGEFRVGVDDTDSDKFKVSAGSALGTNDTFIMTAAGERTMPLQPCFSAQAADQSNVTGDATSYTVTFTSTERFDQNNDFDGTSTFTAPVAGKYLLGATVVYKDMSSNNVYADLRIVTSNATYVQGHVDPYTIATDTNVVGRSATIIADMDAADTATITLFVQRTDKVIDIAGAQTYFFGSLIC